MLPKKSTQFAKADKLAGVRERLRAAAAQLKATFVDRDDAIDAVLLAQLTGEHVLLVGDRGTAKSLVLKTFSRHVTGARHFKAMYGSFTTPAKIFGPDDIKAFQAGRYEVVTAGMLPEADIATGDELLKAPDGVLGEHLGLLNEREFPLGVGRPLHCFMAATNWPEVDGRSSRLQPLYDRFLLRVSVLGVKDEAKLAKLLRAGDALRRYAPKETVSMDELRAAAAEARGVEIPEWVCLDLAKLVVKLAGDGTNKTRGVQISPRRVDQLQGVLRSSAWLAGPRCGCEVAEAVEHADKPCPSPRLVVTIADFDALKFALWEDRGDIEVAEQLLGSIDQAHVQAALTACNEGRQALRNGDQQSNYGQAANAKLAKDVTAAAEKARGIYSGPKLTARGRESVSRALVQLREELEAFARKHPGMLQGFNASKDQGEVANG